MRKFILIILLAISSSMGSCKKDKTTDANEYGDGPRTNLTEQRLSTLSSMEQAMRYSSFKNYDIDYFLNISIIIL